MSEFTMSHFLYKKNHDHSHEDDYKLGRLFVTSQRVRTGIKWTYSKLYTYSFSLQKQSYVCNKKGRNDVNKTFA